MTKSSHSYIRSFICRSYCSTAAPPRFYLCNRMHAQYVCLRLVWCPWGMAQMSPVLVFTPFRSPNPLLCLARRIARYACTPWITAPFAWCVPFYGFLLLCNIVGSADQNTLTRRWGSTRLIRVVSSEGDDGTIESQERTQYRPPSLRRIRHDGWFRYRRVGLLPNGSRRP